VLVGTGIRAGYGPREILHGIDISVQPGEIHALLGANGSGKSTFVKVLTGRLKASGGELAVGDNRTGPIRSPNEAFSLGIRAVHQETPLIDTMSVAENVAIRSGYVTGLVGRIRWRDVYRHTRKVLHSVGIGHVDPDQKAKEVTAADRGLLAVSMALDEGPAKGGGQAKILILDEATASIPEEEAVEVLRSVRQLADSGLAVLMVTHRISEATDFADTMTVLYNGDVAYQGTAKLPEDQIVELIVTGEIGGGQETAGGHEQVVRSGIEAVQVKDLKAGTLNGVTFTVERGEVLGIVGGPQSGTADLAPALAGLVPEASGHITIDGRSIEVPKNPKRAIRSGISLVPRDRLRQGGISSMSVHENVLLASARGPRYNTAAHKTMVRGVIKEFSVTPPRSDLLFREMSGGNQQKLIIGKWLTVEPKLLILDDPTVGVDPGARRTMFEAVAKRCKDDGLAVLVLSSEPEELVRHCHRILALDHGQIVEELTGEQISQVTVSAWANK
jgi:ribose transport system ATP-binding protein